MEAKFNGRIKECENEEEMVKYLLLCVPVIREYTTENEVSVSKERVANLDISRVGGVRRKEIYNKYLKEVEDIHEDAVKPPDVRMDPCKNCGKWGTKFMDEAESSEICTSCGMTEYILGDEVGFKEEQEMDKTVIYSYKRENHFNEWISQFQAKETTSVPGEVITNLRSEFKKQKIKDLSEITHEKVKGLLKKLNYSKYYEHVAYISTILNGVTPPTMPQALEEKLRLMFHAIQAPFEKHKPASRKNFLSSSYVLFKMCELLGQDQYLPCFLPRKSKEKRYIQVQIWGK